MSYEPTIYIDAKDLKNNRDKIEREYHGSIFNRIGKQRKKSEQRFNVLTELMSALELTPIVFHKEQIISITPEFSSHNVAVRQKLTDLKIYYVVDA